MNTWPPLFEIDPEALDDLVDGLRRTGSAQDYLWSAPPRAAFVEWPVRRQRDTVDCELEQPAVPGYRDYNVVVDYGRGVTDVPAGLRWWRRR